MDEGNSAFIRWEIMETTRRLWEYNTYNFKRRTSKVWWKMNLDFEQKFRTCLKKIGEVGDEYAEAKGQSYQMQELKGSVLSKIMLSSTETAVSRAELVARNSEDYTNYIKETSKAITKELKLKAQYEMWKSSFEALRSMCSLEKSTQKEIGE